VSFLEKRISGNLVVHVKKCVLSIEFIQTPVMSGWLFELACVVFKTGNKIQQVQCMEQINAYF